MGNLFTEIERKIIETSNEVCQAALKSSAKELTTSIRNNVFYKVTDIYYEEYTPTRYKRLESLYGAWKVTNSINGDKISFHGNLNSNRLPQHYSGSQYHKYGDRWISQWDDDFDYDSDENGRPENSWILENFFEGIHPRYIKKYGLVWDESYHYDGILKNLPVCINRYKQSGEMVSILAKHLKAQCKKYK